MGIQLRELLFLFITPPGVSAVLVIVFHLADSHYLTHLDSMAVCWRDINKLIFHTLLYYTLIKALCCSAGIVSLCNKF